MPTEEARLEKIERLSKGEAADIITRIKHGAQVSSWRFKITHSF